MKAKYNHSMKNQFLILILILILGCSNSDQSSKDISDQIREDTSDQSTKIFQIKILKNIILI